MAYSLNDKISSFLAKQGVEGAKVFEGLIRIPFPKGGEYRCSLQGVVPKEKLLQIAAEYKAKVESAA